MIDTASAPPIDSHESRPMIIDALLEEASDVLLIVDARLRIRRSSKRAEEALGLPPKGGKGLPLSDFLSDEDDGSLIAALLDRASPPGNRCLESSFKQPNGGVLRSLVVLRPLAKEGRAKGWTLLVCGRFHATSGISDSSRFGPLIERVLRAYEAPVLVLDAASRTVQACNRAATSALGFSREELLGRSLEWLSEKGEFSEANVKVRRYAYATSGIFRTKARLRRKDGVVHPFTITNVALFNDSGVIESVFCFIHDKSDEEARNAELVRTAEELASVSSRLVALTARLSNAGDAAHDLRGRGLSSRQIEIVRLAASGLATKAIADALGLAEVTVKSHLSIIYRKLGVKNRIDLLRFTHEMGIRVD
jgi:PAS domain S-box-containing protein